MRYQDMTLPWPPPKKMIDPNATLPPIDEYTQIPKTGIQEMDEKYSHEADKLWRTFIEKAKAAQNREACTEWIMVLLNCAAHWKVVADDLQTAVQLIEVGE